MTDKVARVYLVAMRPGKQDEARACCVDDTNEGGEYARDFRDSYPHLQIRRVGFAEMQRLMSK